MKWAASASARASNSAQLITRSSWTRAGLSGWLAAIASHTSTRDQAIGYASQHAFLSLEGNWRLAAGLSQTGSAVVYLICSMAKADETSDSGTAPIRRL